MESIVIKASSFSDLLLKASLMIRKLPSGPELSQSSFDGGVKSCQDKKCALDGICINQLNGQLIAECVEVTA